MTSTIVRTSVELRSDTFTRPTPEMMAAIARAPLGDDVYGEDPTANELEERAAELLGKQAACLVPSGTMANLAAITAHCPRGSKALVGDQSDIYVYEAGGASVCSGVVLEPVRTEPDGRLPVHRLAAALPEDPDDPQFAPPALISVENSHNRCGGVPLPGAYLAEVAEFGRRQGMAVHLDGARLFNAAVALDVPVTELTRHADSVQVCLSKGLSAPVGSVVAGDREFVDRVRRIRKMLGGGMRQVGVIAAAGIVALDTMVGRLAEDHANARRLADGLAGIAGIEIDPARVRTNIVMFRVVDDRFSHESFIARLADAGVRLAELGRGQLRAVTHRHVTAEDVDRVLAEVAALLDPA
ncbi:low-specificity L-threonine aldolase [Micromonosporaceae bacterium B7E4]